MSILSSKDSPHLALSTYFRKRNTATPCPHNQPRQLRRQPPVTAAPAPPHPRPTLVSTRHPAFPPPIRTKAVATIMERRKEKCMSAFPRLKRLFDRQEGTPDHGRRHVRLGALQIWMKIPLFMLLGSSSSNIFSDSIVMAASCLLAYASMSAGQVVMPKRSYFACLTNNHDTLSMPRSR